MNIKFIISIILLKIFVSDLGYSQDMKTAEKEVHSLLNKTIKRDSKVHDAFLLVHSDKLDIHWNYYISKTIDVEIPFEENYYFHGASVSKTLTSVAIAMLFEQGMIDFNNPINKYLSEDIIKGLHAYKGNDYSDKILIKHLLNHTSGIPDYLSGKSAEGIGFFEYCIKNPEKTWTPIETINWAKKNGTSNFPPGEGYNYTDTEYQLLGLIIERITGKDYHQVLDEFFFKPLNMYHSSLWLYSEPQKKSKYPLTKVYINKTEVSTFKSINFDWATGGIVTTSEDLLVFMKALNENKLIKAATFQKMQEWQKDTKGIYYGYGLMQYRFKELFFTLPDENITGHSGSIGAFMYYNPTYDIYFTGSFNQSKYKRKHIVFIIKIMDIISKNVKKIER